jgi:hypothetical protein
VAGKRRKTKTKHATSVVVIWNARTRPRFESGDMSPHSKYRLPASIGNAVNTQIPFLKVQMICGVH